MTTPGPLLIGLAICLLQCIQDAESAKMGRCPPPPFGAGRARFCYTDRQCPGRMKCCLTKGGYACTRTNIHYPGPPNPTKNDTKCDEHGDCSKPIPQPADKQKPGTCPPSNMFTGTAPFCDSDSDCKGMEKCCLTKAGHQCVQPVNGTVSRTKPGSCPPSPLGSVGLALFCQTDFDCEGSNKCCMTTVGYDCTPPQKESERINKPGECPLAPHVFTGVELCQSDTDCDGPEKCCFTVKGQECVKPTEEPKPIAKKGSCPPPPVGPVGLANFCQTDYDCDGSMKCCLTTIGYDCKAPVQEREEVQKPGSCPAAPAVTGKALFCRSDKDCDGSEKCCLTKVGKECVQPKDEPKPIAKKGSCPPPPVGPVGLANFCQTDYDCDGSMKCCLTSIGYDCKAPVQESEEVQKPGSCPAAPAVTGKALFCRSDKDCDGSEKCCLTKVGKECVQPTDEPKPIAKKGSCPPPPVGPVGLANFCQTDYDCDGSMKCCLTSIGYDCKAPVQESEEVQKPGACPAAPAVTGKALFCRNDNDCDGREKCCSTKVGKECVQPKDEPKPIAKKGSCPPPPVGPVGLANFCQTDYDCDGSMKCCLTTIGYDCKAPVQESEEVQKPGSCPAAPAITGKALFCRSDKDCDGSEKCCLTKVGKECVQPTDEPKPIAKKGSCPPPPVGPVGLANFCQTDYDCDGSMKCCLTSIGYDCKAPVQESEEVQKPGACPAAPAVTGKALFCRNDNDCDGREKCCSTKVGKECVQPKDEPKPIAKKESCPPPPVGPVGLANFCQTDYDCDGSMKCCLTSIGYDCKAPVQESEEVQKPGSCPAAPAITGKALFCRSDKDCDGSEKCCLTKVGKECVQPKDEPKPIAKKGSCPAPPVGPVGLANFCQTDYDCDGSMKCCLTSIGYDCKAPVQESEEVQKPGSCPAAPAVTGKALFCRSDKDCDGSEKCCLTKVGKECVQPKDEPKPIAKKGSCPAPPVGPVGLANFCQTDYDCDGSMKCCLTSIGYDCKAPVQESEEVQKPGACPAAPAVTGKALFCRNDNDCDGREKCCSTKVGKECVQPVRWPGPNTKPGSCPPSPVGAVGLALFCQSDFDCMGYQKCCITTAGYECTHPVDENVRPSKRGICPWPSSVQGPVLLCNIDDDCEGSQKCCPTKAGNGCINPVSEEMGSGRASCPPAAYVTGLPGSCRRDEDCDGGKKCCDGNDGKSCSVLVLSS